MLGKIADKSLTPGSTEVPLVTGYVVAEKDNIHRIMPTVIAKVAEII